MAEHDDAFADAQKELLKRLSRYKHAPTLAAIVHRMKRYCGGENEVDAVVLSLVKSGKLRVTNKLFHLPTVWDEFFSSLG